MKVKYFVLSMISPVLLVLLSYGQFINMADEEPCRSVEKAVGYVARSEPRLSDQIMTQDLGAIRTAQKHVREYYAKRGIDKCAADAATALAWKDMRLRQPRGKLDESVLVEQASEGFGGLKILSIPAGAVIKVDGKLWGKPTNTEVWMHAGTRMITLSLDGYEDLEGKKTVVAASIVQFKGTMMKKKK
jgi:hypothetical protein